MVASEKMLIATAGTRVHHLGQLLTAISFDLRSTHFRVLDIKLLALQHL